MNSIKKCAIKLTIKEYLIWIFYVIVGIIFTIISSFILINWIFLNNIVFLIWCIWTVITLLIIIDIALMID
jgi:hypothetical protein